MKLIISLCYGSCQEEILSVIGILRYYLYVKRNLLLFFAVILSLILIVNSAKRLSSLRSTSQKVDEAQRRLETLRRENEDLKREAEYKKSDQFIEGEIRDKLGMAKKGEAIVVLPRENDERPTPNDQRQNIPNYIKWWDLFFRS